jgi:hypothetical protein
VYHLTMRSSSPNANLPGTRLLSETPFARLSLTATPTLALTSKQRTIGTDLLQTVTRLLRCAGPHLEAAALQDAMQDAEASEFVSAAMAQAEASAVSNESTVVGSSASAIPSVPFFHVESSGTLQAAARRSTSPHAELAPLKPATVLRTRPSVSTTVAHSSITTEESCIHDTGNDGSTGTTTHTRPQRQSSHYGSSFSTTELLSVTQSPHSCATTSSSRGFPERKAAALVSVKERATRQDNHSYHFPLDWFSADAVERLAAPLPALGRPNVSVDKGEPHTTVPLLEEAPVERHIESGVPPQRTTAATAPSTASSVASSSTLPLPHHSKSLSTAAFAWADAPAAAASSLTSPVSDAPPTRSFPLPKHQYTRDGAADGKLNSLSSYLNSMPSLTQAPRPSGFGVADDRVTVVTAQPPLFVDNMLHDPASGKFLFGGHAFREEARVLYSPSTFPVQADAATTSGESDRSSAGAAAAAAIAARQRLFRLASATAAAGTNTRRHEATAALVLVREYFPVLTISATGAGGVGGGGGCGQGLVSINASVATRHDIVVQCFSLLPSWLTQVPPNRYHLLSEAVTIACVCQALPGCVTVVTPLSRFLRGARHASLTATSQASQLTNSVSAFGGMLRVPPGGLDGTSEQRALAQKCNYIGVIADGGGGGGDSAAGEPHAFSIHSATLPIPDNQEELEESRIMALAERLSAVPPDVLDEALATVRYSLAFYADYVTRRRRLHAVLHAVRVLQRFFRRCLAVKRRALRRMTRMWRTLEVEARLKLQQHRVLPSAVERVDAVANTILQEHMLTSLEYKHKFIQDEWVRRRAAFAKWKEEEDWNVLFAAEQQQARLQEKNAPRGSGGTDGNNGSRSNDGGSGNDHDGGDAKAAHTPVGVLRLSSPARPRSARLTAEEEQRMADIFQRRSEQRENLLHGRGCPATTFATVASTLAAVGEARSPPTLDAAQAQRYQTALRHFCSWYIDPHELLYLSHQRLLETLKGTVLRMEEVQSELNRAAAEVVKDATATLRKRT